MKGLRGRGWRGWELERAEEGGSRRRHEVLVDEEGWGYAGSAVVEQQVGGNVQDGVAAWKMGADRQRASGVWEESSA